MALVLVAGALVWTPLGASAATQPTLGTDSGFAVLGGSTVTNTGPTSITGDLGLSPGSSVTGFPPGLVNGAVHVDDAVSVQAKSDVTTADNSAAAQPCTSTLTGDLGGRTLTPGVYCFTSAAQLTGTLTLNGGGDPNAVFIFKIGSTLTTATSSRVALINGAPCGVYWQVGSSATLGTGTAFVGTLLVGASITLDTGADILPGRALTGTGAVTLDSNRIVIPPASCATVSTSSTTSLTSSPNRSASGGPVVFTSTVTSGGAGTPTGTVAFEQGTTVLGTAPLNSSGTATLTTAGLAPGTHTVTAVYTGAPGILPSVSSPLVQTVSAAPASPSSHAVPEVPTSLGPPSVTAVPTFPGVGTPHAGVADDGLRYGAGLVLIGTLLLLLLSVTGTGLGDRRRERRAAS